MREAIAIKVGDHGSPTAASSPSARRSYLEILTANQKAAGKSRVETTASAVASKDEQATSSAYPPLGAVMSSPSKSRRSPSGLVAPLRLVEADSEATQPAVRPSKPRNLSAQFTETASTSCASARTSTSTGAETGTATPVESVACSDVASLRSCDEGGCGASTRSNLVVALRTHDQVPDRAAASLCSSFVSARSSPTSCAPTSDTYSSNGSWQGLSPRAGLPATVGPFQRVGGVVPVRTVAASSPKENPQAKTDISAPAAVPSPQTVREDDAPADERTDDMQQSDLKQFGEDAEEEEDQEEEDDPEDRMTESTTSQRLSRSRRRRRRRGRARATVPETGGVADLLKFGDSASGCSSRADLTGRSVITWGDLGGDLLLTPAGGRPEIGSGFTAQVTTATGVCHTAVGAFGAATTPSAMPEARLRSLLVQGGMCPSTPDDIVRSWLFSMGVSSNADSESLAERLRAASCEAYED